MIKMNISSSWNTIKNIYMNVSGSWVSIKKGYINVSGVWKLFFSSFSAPTQTSSPALAGTGEAFSSITGFAGTYTSGTYLNISHFIAATSDSNTPTDGLTSLPSGIGSVTSSNSYTITQSDTFNSGTYFYYVDQVRGNDGNYYYYYSNSVKANVGIIFDNFNRTVPYGLGTASSSYVYSSFGNNLSISVNGSQSVFAQYMSSSETNPLNYSMQSIELSGRTSIDGYVELSGSYFGGLGMAFWVTGNGSWFASTVYESSYSATKYTYYTTVSGTSCTAGAGTDCGSSIVTMPCTRGHGNSAVNCGFDYTCPNNYSYIGSGLCTNNNVPYNTTGATITYYGTYTTTVYSGYVNSSSCSGGPYVSYDSLPSNCSSSSSTVSLYNTSFKILKSDGSTVSVLHTDALQSGVENPTKIGAININVNGSTDTITSKAYTDGTYSSQIGSTSTYTASNPTKNTPIGSSSAGLIKGTTGTNAGIYFDNLSIYSS